MAILSFRKHSLRTRDDRRTPASELTLRQSIYPLCLVTILFFLWVHCSSSVLTRRGTTTLLTA